MKKLSIVGVLALVILASCKKDEPKQPTTPSQVTDFKDLKIPDNFTFNTFKDINLNIQVENPGFNKSFLIKVYDYLPTAGGSLIYSGFTSNDQISASVKVPQALNRLYLVKEDPTGSSTLSIVEMTGSSVSHTFGKNKKSKKTLVVSPDCNSGCDHTVSSGGYLNINSSDTYCITGNIGGINDNNGNAVIRICGNVTISGNASIKGNTELQITDGSTLNIVGINMNNHAGNKGVITVYTTGTLNINSNFSAHGTVTNHGNFTVSNDTYLYGDFTNNGTFEVTGTGYSTMNNGGTITNNGTMIYNGYLTENSNATFINNCYLQVKKDFMINSQVDNYSYIQVDQNFRSNSNSKLDYHNGSMMYVKGDALGPLNGDMEGIDNTSVLKVDGGISSNSNSSISGNLELCIGGSTSGLHVNTIGSPAVLQCDGAYIPTSPCNPEGNGTPTVADADNDGVADENDLFPNDPLKAGEMYFPGSNTFGTLAFEDLWPSQGDYDFNDIVVDYRFRAIINANSEVVEMEIDYVLRAIGGSLKNGFGVQFDLLQPSDVASVVRDGNFVSQNLNANGTETGQSKAVIIFFENAFDVLTNPGTPTVNTDLNFTHAEVDTNSIRIVLNSPKDGSVIAGNPFIYIGQDREKEVHLSGALPTDRANSNYFGTAEDATDPSQNKYYVTENNLPWAINIAQHWEYPVEKQDIVQAYLQFAGWAQSGGATNESWYADQPGFRDESLIYDR